MYQRTLLNKWWLAHKRYAGEVWKVKCDTTILDSPENYIDKTFEQFKKLPLEDVMAFSEAEITDNNMENREVLEDASKIHYLRHCIRNDGLNFAPQLLHEPWKDRYRVHPGSGRFAALWLEGYREFDAIYIHFVENNFVSPARATELKTQAEFIQAIKLNNIEPYYETYFAFPKVAKDCRNTLNMDREWQWHHTPTYIPWKFIRWSEGPEFLNYKRNWRSYGIDLWRTLNGI
jgi:hypothetical protein